MQLIKLVNLFLLGNSMFTSVICLLYSLTKSTKVQLVPKSFPNAAEKICATSDIEHASLTVDNYFTVYFKDTCNLDSITKVILFNYGTNQTIQLTHTVTYPRLYYSQLTSYMASSPMFLQIIYPHYSFSGLIPVSLHRTPCLIADNIVAGTYEQTLYIYPKNFSVPMGPEQIYCDTYLNPHLAISVSGTALNCVFHEYYYSCALSSGSISSDITILSIYNTSPIIISSSDVKQFTKLCFTESPDTNSDSTYSFYTSVYSKNNQTTLVVRHPYLSTVTPPTPPANTDCLPLICNCTYDGVLMNRFSYHLTANYTGKKPTQSTAEAVTITCSINSTKTIERKITSPPIEDKYVCFHSFVVAEKPMNSSVTSLNDMFIISNMKVELTPFLLNIQDSEATCTLLPNTYLKINTTIFQKNYTNYAFNYQMDATNQNSVSLIALTNIDPSISNLYMLLPQYLSDGDAGDITLDTYQGVPIFDFLSYTTENCYALDQIRYYCVNNVLYVSTQNFCSPPNPPDSLNISLYDASGPSQTLKLNKYSSVSGQNYIHNYTAVGNNEICTAKPYFSTDKYQYAGIYLFINPKFPVHIAIELTATYCSLMDPAFDYQVQLFETTLYFQGLCKLDGYCFEDIYSYTIKPLQLIPNSENPTSPIETPRYKYFVPSIIGSDMPYLINLRTCSRSDEIKTSNFGAPAVGLLGVHDYFYSYFQSPMAHEINWNNQTRQMILNYTRSCIEAPAYSNATWYVQLIESFNWGILVLGITGGLCSSNGIDVIVTFFAVYTDLNTQRIIEQPILTEPMTLVDTLSASHKYHIRNNDIWESYLKLKTTTDAIFYANLTFKYTFFTTEKYYIPISNVTEPCIVRTLTTKLLEIDYSTTILEIYSQETCYMLSDYVYLVLPVVSLTQQAALLEKNLKEIVVLEELLLNSFYSLEDVWAFIDNTNVIDIAVAIEWSESSIPRLQLKTTHARTPETWERYSSRESPSGNTVVSEDEIMTMFNMRHSSLDMHALAPSLYKYWRLATTTLPLLNTSVGEETNKGTSMPTIPLPLTFKLSTIHSFIPDYSVFPTLAEQLKKDLNTDLSTDIITNQAKYNVSGLLGSKVISFSVGKTIFYNATPLSFYQYNNFIMLVLTLGNSTNKQSNVDTNILIMQSPIYTPFLLLSNAFETQVEVIDDYLTIYCPSCILYDQVLYVTDLHLIELISRSNVQSLPVYLSTRAPVNAVRYNYSYTIRIGVQMNQSNVSFHFPIYNKNMSLSTQFIPNVCFINGYMKACLKSNKLFILLELVNCIDMRPSSIVFTLTAKENLEPEVALQLGAGNKVLTTINENENWVSYIHIFNDDKDVNASLLMELATNNILNVVLRASIGNTLVTRLMPIDITLFSVEEQYWVIYLIIWIAIIIILSMCTWVIIKAYRLRNLKREIITLANHELSRNPALYRDIENSFHRYMNENGISHSLLALHVLLKVDWSIDEIAQECKTIPKVIGGWEENLKGFLSENDRADKRRKSALEKMKHKLMTAERRKNMQRKTSNLFIKRNKKRGIPPQTHSVDNLLSTDSEMVHSNS
ncbi:Hypothetical protein GLP15_725 [Giardia lamblia P15]|uniref:Uncharacterized protein n=1 Tax=Giardia intestinalis (strain P15) TaxID=658858 RepID=E1F3Z7_GIAIA|nr:Hypothetical protein GLP15_725 [Giardia lamblia P15]